MVEHRRAQELSERLDMLASQLRESLSSSKDRPPLPWSFDDWLTEYRRWYQARRKTQ